MRDTCIYIQVHGFGAAMPPPCSYELSRSWRGRQEEKELWCENVRFLLAITELYREEVSRLLTFVIAFTDLVLVAPYSVLLSVFTICILESWVKFCW